MELQEKLSLACWIAKRFFDRGMGSGTSGNLSFMHAGRVYITGGGSCFGRLSPEQFSAVDPLTMEHTGPRPSKELLLHLAAYRRGEGTGAVIHIHSTYATLWSCLPHTIPQDCVPDYTPYLKMKLGTVGLVPYAKPGSRELFAAFEAALPHSDGWLLAHHGLVVPGGDLMDAFGCAEELEESCRIAWELQGKKIAVLSSSPI